MIARFDRDGALPGRLPVLNRSRAAWLAAFCLTVFFNTRLAQAQSSSSSYSFMVATGFLCDSGESGGCPAVATSTDGDSFEIGGAGTFDTRSGSVKAAGTFSHKSKFGDVLEAGVWIVDEFVSFNSYGMPSTVLLQKGPAFSATKLGPKTPLRRPGPSSTGGLAIFHVLLMPLSGAATGAVLEVNAASGDVPRERSVEGIHLRLDRDRREFSEVVSGRAMFFTLRDH